MTSRQARRSKKREARSEVEDFALTPAAYPGFTASERSALEAAAQATVRQELVLPSDLDAKVPRLIEACKREAVELRKTLVQISNAQVRDAQHSIRLLDNCRLTAEELRVTFQQLEGRDSVDLHPTSYNWLKELFQFRENVHSIVSWVEKLKRSHDCPMGQMLDEKKLADAYIILRDVQKIRVKVRESDSRDYNLRNKFQLYFVKCSINIQLLAEEVHKTLGETVDRIIEAALREQDLAEMSPADIRAMEEQTGERVLTADEIMTPVRECLQICLAESKSHWLRFKEEDHDNARDLDSSPLDLTAVTRGLCDSVDGYWREQVLREVEEDPIKECRVVFEMMKKLPTAFSAIEQGLIGLSTSKLPCTTIVMRRFHQRIIAFLIECVDHEDELSSEHLVEGMQFTLWYSAFLETDGFKQYLQDVGVKKLERVANSFLAAAVDGLESHMTDLASKCAMRVCADPIQQLPTGEIFTNGPVDLFTILQMSITPVTSMAETRILTQLSNSCVEAMKSYLETIKGSCSIDSWENKMLDENVEAKREEWGDQRMMCMAAYCNDMTKIEENVELIESKFATVLEADQSPFQDFLPELSGSVFFFVQNIAEHIEYEISRRGWEKMFTSADWVLGNPLGDIVSTVEDYFNNQDNASPGLHLLLEEDHLKKLQRTFVPMFTARYLTEMLRYLGESKNHQIAADTFAGFFSRDITSLSDMWINISADQNAGKLVRNSTAAMTALYHLMRAESQEQFAVALSQHIMGDFGDCPTFVVETLIQKRSDLDKKMKENFSQQWKAKIVDQERDAQDCPTTNWLGGRSILGHITKSERKGGFFGFTMFKTKTAEEKKRDKKRKELEKKNKEKEKERKRREAAAAKAAKRSGGVVVTEAGSGEAGGAGPEETESLEAVLARTGQ